MIERPLSEAVRNLKLGKYEHYKGGEYQVLGVATHSESKEELVIYQALYGDGQIWVRPLAMFIDEIVFGGTTRPRFKFTRDNII